MEKILRMISTKNKQGLARIFSKKRATRRVARFFLQSRIFLAEKIFCYSIVCIVYVSQFCSC